MANPQPLANKLLRLEGGFVYDKFDRGGATNKGVTLNTFRAYYGQDKTTADLKAITADEWTQIFKAGYWDKMKADDIRSQSVAELLVDFAYNSGVATASRHIQALVGTKTDGVIGPKTISAINAHTPRILFQRLQRDRLQYVENIVKANPSQRRFLQGWRNRINSFHYES